MIRSNYKKAFTLAEILITLTIIGVIATLTIPALVQSTNDNELKTKWKKEFSTISQATLLVRMKVGGSLKGICASDDSNCLSDLYKEYLNYAVIAQDDNDQGNIWHKDNEWKQLNNIPESLNDTEAGFILTDGTLIHLWTVESDCNATSVPCAQIYVDVNGFKAPNTVGKDIFLIDIMENATKPTGSIEGEDGPDISCIPGSTDATNTGYGCSAKYLMQ